MTHLSFRKELCQSIQNKSQEAENEGRSTEEVSEKGSALANVKLRSGWKALMGLFYLLPQSSKLSGFGGICPIPTFLDKELRLSVAK